MFENDSIAEYNARAKRLYPQKNKKPENSVKKSVTAWLDLHKILWNRQQAGMLKVVAPGTGAIYWVHLAQEGAADIVACVRGRHVEIETKKLKGKQRKIQITYQAKVENAGGIYILADSLEALERGIMPLMKP